ncbi:WbuC family cupin fold metalloprotein [Alphaproteobacteria bacterium]|nr:WbuC family cupin fold metalloprotein [Alphaproteobacteria bacterium]
MDTNSLYIKESIFTLDSKKIEFLKKKALESNNKRFRFCLHQNNNDNVNEMIIAAHISTIIEPHRHPINKPESYYIIEGSLRVNIFNDNRQVIQIINLYSDKYPKMYRIMGKIWHQPVPISEWVIYHEVYTGPFIKELDVEYL